MSKLRKTLSILVAVALVVTLLTPAAFAADNKVQRVAGENRYETSADIALDKFDSAETVIIVNGEDRFAYADGLAASVLAGALDAPILLTDANELSDAVADAIEELGASKAYILGGTTAVSKAVEEALEDLDLDITRLDGENRYETAALIAEEADTDSKTAYVVNGWANADAMVAGAAAFNNGNPILLVEKDNVRKETADALKDLGIENVIIVGGTSVVSAAVANELDKDYDVKRIAGEGRYETSAVFAKETFNNPAGVSVVNGWRLADAIGASVYGNPILYANYDAKTIDEPVEAYIDELLENNVNLKITLFGGEVALSAAIENALQEKLDAAVPKEIKEVKSVEAITDTVDIAKNKEQLEFTVNNGVKATVQDLLNEGYEVEFVADANTSKFNVDKDTGEVRFPLDANGIKAAKEGDEFKYQVIVRKNDDTIRSNVKTVKAVDSFNKANSINVTKILVDGVENESGKLSLKSDNNVELAEIEYTNSQKVKKKITAGNYDSEKVKLSSSNPAVVAIEKEGQITPVNTGTATITVEVAGLKKNITLNVVNEERKPNKAESDYSTIKLAPSSDRDFTLTVRDQFGDPMKDVVILNSDVKNNDNDVIAQFTGDTTDNEGKATVNLQANPGFAGQTGTLSIIAEYGSNNKKTGSLARIAVQITGTTTVDHYKIVKVNSDDDFKLDVYEEEDDNTLLLRVNEYNSSDVLLGKVQFTTKNADGTLEGTSAGKTITAEADGEAVELDIENGNIKVIAKKKGNATVVVKNDSGITLASQAIQVVDTTPALAGVQFVNIGTHVEIADIKVSDVIKPSNVSVDNQRGVVRLSSDGQSLYLDLNNNNTYDGNDVEIAKISVSQSGDFEHTLTINANGRIGTFAAGDEGNVIIKVEGTTGPKNTYSTAIKVDIPK